ncbi:TniQ family protein [Arthrobacter sp. ISL-5]|uniref:TniQ family protein n=1 Tax=Arthrobacter sp. ISL-5 TaxID=2819111 RepID=UPI001BE51F78|nr:TniQ family protein [Arthrobacter sp. ISL-5]MBT2556080.1 TniQ family protein [Arthrobacter sp. ISL-5]
MTGPRRWPVHPAPIDGETFSSWLHRIADCYSTDLNVLADDLGFTLAWRPPEDIDVAATSGMIDVLTERTGVTPDQLEQMGAAGWVPWRLNIRDEVQQSEQRTCRFPGCVRPAVSADAGTGRPPGYCDNEGHNRTAAWRARRRPADELSRSAPDEKRPVDASRQRAGELSGQVAGMVERLGQQLTALIEELRTVADPDAAEAQIESVTAEAATEVAAATARTSRAEQAQRLANAERLEADAATSEASDLAEQQHATLAVTQHELGDRTHTLDQMTAELAAVRAAAEAQNAQAQAELSQLREQLATVRTRLGEAEHECDDANARSETASTARAESDGRARGAVARADDNAARAQRAEADLAKIRDEIDQSRIVRDTIWEEASSLRGNLATATVERDAAWADVERERTHGDQRVSDLRTAQDQQLTLLRDEAAELRQEVREQRGRADRAQAHPTAQTDAAATKPAT